MRGSPTRGPPSLMSRYRGCAHVVEQDRTSYPKLWFVPAGPAELSFDGVVMWAPLFFFPPPSYHEQTPPRMKRRPSYCTPLYSRCPNMNRVTDETSSFGGLQSAGKDGPVTCQDGPDQVARFVGCHFLPRCHRGVPSPTNGAVKSRQASSPLASILYLGRRNRRFAWQPSCGQVLLCSSDRFACLSPVATIHETKWRQKAPSHPLDCTTRRKSRTAESETRASIHTT